MKKILYSMLAVIALSCTFVACGDDNDDPSFNYTTTAEKAAAGTYSGTFSHTLSGATEDFSGTITIAPTDSAGYADITIACPDANINAKSVVNIWNSNDGFQFVNQVASNGLGVAFAGRIFASGTMNMGFTITQKVGRKSYEYVYAFEGSK